VMPRSSAPFSLEISRSPTNPRRGDEVGRVDLWLYTDDVDREVDRLRENGATVVDEPADREWGERMATVTDPDGNFLHVGSR
jgi:lactoylglutathione lyase